jgi:hypothetical protein
MQNTKVGTAAMLAACCVPVVHAAQTQQPQVIHDMPVSEATLVQENAGSGRITGVLTNTSGHQLQSVVVQFSLVDDQGTQVATASAATMGLADGGKWRFAAPYIGATGDVASAKLGVASWRSPSRKSSTPLQRGIFIPIKVPPFRSREHSPHNVPQIQASVLSVFATKCPPRPITTNRTSTHVLGCQSGCRAQQRVPPCWCCWALAHWQRHRYGLRH